MKMSKILDAAIGVITGSMGIGKHYATAKVASALSFLAYRDNK